MKKSICLILCVCILGLSACGNRLPTPIEQLCQADVITVTTSTLICSMEMHQNGCTFRFASPEILDELTVDYDGKVLHAVYGDIETDVAASFANGLFPLYHAVCAFKTQSPVQSAKNIHSVTLDETEFLLYYDTEGGIPTRLETKGADGITFCYDILSCIKNDDDAESTRTNTSE